MLSKIIDNLFENNAKTNNIINKYVTIFNNFNKTNLYSRM